MAAVVIASEENSYFGKPALRRSHSQPKFASKSASFHSSSSASRLNEPYTNPIKVYSDSAPSSAPSSPRTNLPESSELSWASTPASNLSVVSDLDDTLIGNDADHFILPQYESEPLFNPRLEVLESPSSEPTGESSSSSPADNANSNETSRPGSPEDPEPFVDDTAVRAQPSRHVDYLSHNWREEDIWSSWKYIISRRGDYANAERLENASWRTWMKAKNKLKTVSPETLNWLKDCDVTWLYGPLQTGSHHLAQGETNPGSSKLSRSNSFSGNKKPILKKRSMSEIMLQRSLSNSSLVKQAAAAVQAQEKEAGRRRIMRPTLERAATDYLTFPFSSRRMSGNDLSSLSSVESSGIASPSGERKHIHFNEQVEQCIAVEIRGDDDDDLDTDRFPEDSDSDDGGLTMKRSTRRKKLPVKKKTKTPAPAETKIIAMLPSTTLKSREESPDAPDTAQKHSVFRSPVISPSSSQETLRPSKATTKKMKLVFDDDDSDEDDSDEDDDNPVNLPFRGSSSSSTSGNASEARGSSLQRSTSTSSLNAEPAGMRRTPSGMFMPYEEGESSATEGIFGRVIDTVNTARDIAHVIWNVGWRK